MALSYKVVRKTRREVDQNQHNPQNTQLLLNTLSYFILLESSLALLGGCESSLCLRGGGGGGVALLRAETIVGGRGEVEPNAPLMVGPRGGVAPSAAIEGPRDGLDTPFSRLCLGLGLLTTPAPTASPRFSLSGTLITPTRLPNPATKLPLPH